MSAKSCSACNDLRETSATFVQNGVTDAICNNLSKNLGLNSGKDHDDCEDLHDINDCLIANMDDEMDAFDVCEWKDFMHQYIPNNYETLKAMICSMCGQWDRMDDMCKLIGNVLQPPYKKIGTLPLHENPTYRCGTIPNKNGQPIMKKIDNPYSSGTEQYTLWNHTCNVGIQYTKLKVKSCEDGSCTMYEWLMPSTHHYQISQYAEIGDVIWYVSKSTLQSVCGFSDALWHAFDISSWTWKGTPITGYSDISGVPNSRGKSVWLTLTVAPGNYSSDYIGLEINGTSYPNGYDDPNHPNVNYVTGYNATVAEMDPAPRVYINACE